MPPEEKKNLRAQIECLQRELCREKIKVKWMKKETDVQSMEIAQLKRLLTSNQTKLGFTQGHRSCVIDHEKFNFVRMKKNLKNSNYREKRKCSSSLLLHPVRLANVFRFSCDGDYRRPTAILCCGNADVRGKNYMICCSPYYVPVL